MRDVGRGRHQSAGLRHPQSSCTRHVPVRGSKDLSYSLPPWPIETDQSRPLHPPGLSRSPPPRPSDPFPHTSSAGEPSALTLGDNHDRLHGCHPSARDTPGGQSLVPTPPSPLETLKLALSRALDKLSGCTALPPSPSRERRMNSPLLSHSTVGGTPQSRCRAPCSPVCHTWRVVSMQDLGAVPFSSSSPRSLKGRFGPSVLPRGAQNLVTGMSSQCDEGSGERAEAPSEADRVTRLKGLEEDTPGPRHPLVRGLGGKGRSGQGLRRGRGPGARPLLATAAPWPPGEVPESERCFLRA